MGRLCFPSETYGLLTREESVILREQGSKVYFRSIFYLAIYVHILRVFLILETGFLRGVYVFQDSL